MKSYSELLAEHAELTRLIEAAKAEERDRVLEEVRADVAKYGIARDDLFPRKTSRRPTARYRNPQTGETWSGRGRPPAWIEGKDRDKFAVNR